MIKLDIIFFQKTIRVFLFFYCLIGSLNTYGQEHLTALKQQLFHDDKVLWAAEIEVLISLDRNGTDYADSKTSLNDSTQNLCKNIKSQHIYLEQDGIPSKTFFKYGHDKEYMVNYRNQASLKLAHIWTDLPWLTEYSKAFYTSDNLSESLSKEDAYNYTTDTFFYYIEEPWEEIIKINTLKVHQKELAYVLKGVVYFTTDGQKFKLIPITIAPYLCNINPIDEKTYCETNFWAKIQEMPSTFDFKDDDVVWASRITHDIDLKKAKEFKILTSLDIVLNDYYNQELQNKKQALFDLYNPDKRISFDTMPSYLAITFDVETFKELQTHTIYQGQDFHQLKFVSEFAWNHQLAIFYGRNIGFAPMSINQNKIPNKVLYYKKIVP